ncbi:MAG: hypothetical protein OER86_02000, partial [Phycisphaerae bacterium]|nr:hypothetical protein [Phycisphaerae bacterium]
MNSSIPSTSTKQAEASVAPGAPAVAAERGIRWARLAGVAKTLLRPLASLKLTVVLFALAVLLIFFGTLAQIENGLWYVLKEIFRAEYKLEWLWGLPIPWFAKIELRSLGFYRWDIPGHFYFPGGWMIGSVMLVNLLCAHALRFKIKARGTRLWWGLGVVTMGVVITGVVIAGLLQAEVDATEAGSGFWRVLWRLTSGGLAAVILYVGCVMVFYRRAGIVLLHSGIIFLLISELIAGKFAVEGQMRLREGESGNYAMDIRSAEIAVIDRSEAGFDQVVAVPESRIEDLSVVSHAKLPFDIKPVVFMRNHRLVKAEGSAGVVNPATAGLGKRFV